MFEIPLLVESGHWKDRLNKVLVVDCQVSTQIQRVMLRSGMPEATVRQIILAQASRAERLAAADLVITNEGLTLAELRREVEKIAPLFGL